MYFTTITNKIKQIFKKLLKYVVHDKITTDLKSDVWSHLKKKLIFSIYIEIGTQCIRRRTLVLEASYSVCWFHHVLVLWPRTRSLAIFELQILQL